jgi:hypothetical protein
LGGGQNSKIFECLQNINKLFWAGGLKNLPFCTLIKKRKTFFFVLQQIDDENPSEDFDEETKQALAMSMEMNNTSEIKPTAIEKVFVFFFLQFSFFTTVPCNYSAYENSLKLQILGN